MITTSLTVALAVGAVICTIANCFMVRRLNQRIDQLNAQLIWTNKLLERAQAREDA